MNFVKVKLNSENFILTNQRYMALFYRVAVFVAKFIPFDGVRIKIYDLYLRYNFSENKSFVILRESVELSRKILRPCVSGASVQTIIRSIILKNYISEKEKGVILVSFENQLDCLAKLSTLNVLEKEYQIIFLPSWQPFYSTAFYNFLSRIKEPFWIMPSSARDLKLCETVGDLCLPLPFQASSWVDSDKYMDCPKDRDIDIIMLANFSKYKRHWLLFEALAELKNDLKVVIAGRPLGDRNKESLISEARSFGVSDKICIVQNPSNDEVRDMLRRAKIFCALSHKEGSYIAVVEAMFSGATVLMYEDAIIGSKDFVNSNTGVLINKSKKLSDGIIYLLSNYKNFDPKGWAGDNISARINSVKLNSIIKQHDISIGNSWTCDIEPFYCENFNFYFYNKFYCGEVERQRIKNKFNLDVKMN